MPLQSIVTGGTNPTLLAHLESELKIAKPSAVGLASAYVSVVGADELLRLLNAIKAKECRLLAGIDGEITHPQALSTARQAGWDVRIGKPFKGIFHPKLIVGGKKFDSKGKIEESNFAYLGSGNITRGGLLVNVECGFTSLVAADVAPFADSFSSLWNNGTTLTDPLLASYTKRFSERNRKRTKDDLEFLGVADFPNLLTATTAVLRTTKPPTEAQHSIPTTFAAAAWAGLQSFTGEYQFQVEFPRAAGEVVQRMLVGQGVPADVACEDKVRKMNFHYYEDNSMFRLNIPFDVPNVEWAKANHDGIAFVAQGKPGGPPIQLRVLKPGKQLNEAVGKSVALGTWGRTPTRLYGWM